MSKIKVPKKTKLIPVPTLLKKAEKVFNNYIRKRDEGLKCISCDNPGNQGIDIAPPYKQLEVFENNNLD